MTNYEYRKKALVFEREGMSPAERLVHSVLGIISELNELNEALNYGDAKNVIEEAGDLLWFAALAEDVANLPEGYTPAPEDLTCKPLDAHVAKLADIAKAAFAYKRPFPADFAVVVCNLTRELRDTLEFSAKVNLAYAEVANLRKLAARYAAGKFSFDNANMRNVAAEYAAMEGAQ